MDPKRQPDLEFAYGSGQINPVAAVNPGLVFNASEADYVNFLCQQGYNTSTLRLVTGDDSVCTGIKPGRAWNLNYPSYSLYVKDGEPVYGVFTRTVTNVGFANSTYSPSWYSPDNIDISVEPSTLSFSAVGSTQSFTVTVTGPKISQQPIRSGVIVWSNADYFVRTPIVVYNYLPGAPYNLDTFQQSSSGPAKKTTFEVSSTNQKKDTFRHK